MESYETGVEFILERVNGSDTIVLDEHVQTYTCGRGKRNQIVCLSLWVSREHCLFIRNQNTLNVVDLSSSNGVYVNGEKIAPKQMKMLQENDIIGIGSPDLDPPDITMFVYILRVSKPKHLSIENSSATLTRTVLNVNNSILQNSDEAVSDNKQRRRSFLENSSLYLPRKVAKLDSSELCGDAIQRVLDNIEIYEKMEIRPVSPVLWSSTKEDQDIDIDLPINSRTTNVHVPNADNQKENMPSPMSIESEKKNNSMTNKLPNGLEDCVDINTSSENQSNSSASEIEEIPRIPRSPVTIKNFATNYYSNLDPKRLKNNKTSLKNQIDSNEEKNVNNTSLVNIEKNLATVNRNSSNGGCISIQKSKIASGRNNSLENDVVLLSDRKNVELHENKSSHNSTTMTSAKAIYNKSQCSSNNSSSLPRSCTKENNVPSSTIKSRNSLRDNQAMEISCNEQYSVEPSNEKMLSKEKSPIDKAVASSNGIINIEDDIPVKIEMESQQLNNDYHTPVTSPLRSSQENLVISPIKVRQLKLEPTTTFSTTDIVNLSDDEEDIFPSSQLFDTTADAQLEIKEEIKGEVDNELFQTPYDTDSIILLSDSEDEDNPWLQRLSRSQVLLEEDEPAPQTVQSKKRHSDHQITKLLDGKDEEKSDKKTDNDEKKGKKSSKAKHKLHSKKHREEDAMEVDAAVPDDTLLSDSEDEDNALMQRLSRSQVLLEEDEPAPQTVQSKKRLSDHQITKLLDGKSEEKSDKKTDNDEKKGKKSSKVKHKLHSKKHREEDAMEVDAAVPDDTLLSDSEDEDNPLMQRLPRSQVLLEEDEPAPQTVQSKKRLSDHQITKLLDGKGEEKSDKKTDNDEKKGKKSSKAKHKLHSKKHGEEDAMEVDAAVPDDTVPPKKSEKKHLDHKKHKTHKKRLSDQLIDKELNGDESPQTSTKNKSPGSKGIHHQDNLCHDNILTIGSKTSLSTTDKLKTTPIKLSSLSKKPPKIIAPPHLPKGEGKGFSYNVQRSTTTSSLTVSTTTSRVAEDTLDTTETKTTPKTTSQVKLSTKERKELLIQKKLEKANYMKEQKHRREKYKWADCLPVSNKKKSPSLSKAEKLEIINDRKAKLKKLADEKKAAAEGSTPTRRIINKPKAKVSQKSRGDFLINPQDIDKESTSAETTSSRPVNIAGKSSTSTDKRMCSTMEETHAEKKSAAKSTSEKSLRINSDNTSSASVPGDIENVALNLRDSLTLSKCPTRDVRHAHREKVSHKSSPSAATSAKSRSRSTERTNTLEDPRNRKIRDPSKTKQKENCSPNATTSVPKNTNKKRVSFSTELVQVRYYEIESSNTLNKVVGKDAPIPQEKLATQPFPKLEDFLLRILMWNPVWLEEQRRFKIDPPVTGNDELIPLLTSYKTFDEYYRIIMPLLLLELWHGITKEFDVIDKNPKRPTVICSIVSNSASCHQIPSSKLSVTNMMLEVLATKEDIHKKAHPVYGDLVFFELGYTNKGKQRFHKVFAYVTNVYQTILTPQTHYNRDLANYVKHPYALLTYTVMTKPLEVNVHANRAQRLRSITYLRSNIRMIQALQYLPSSPLLSAILNPKANDMHHSSVVSKFKNYPLVTKEKLNHKQLEAVIKVTDAIVQKEAKICLIQGPPGTGKSKVIVNIVTQVLYGDNRYQKNRAPLRILVCAPSNAAIDEIVLRLLAIRAKFKDRFKMVRVGRIETMHPTVKEISVPDLARRDIKKLTSGYSSNAYSMDSVEEEKRILEARSNALRSELTSSQNKDENHLKYLKMKLAGITTKLEMLKCRKPVNEMDSRTLGKLQRDAEIRILSGADIITCTLNSCYTNQMESIFGGNKERISVCIVDEATQTNEPQTLIPLMLGVNTLVLVGDPNQLPATVLSQQAKKFGLDQSLFSRIQNAMEDTANNPIIMLDTQYRMAYAIAYWPNKFFYGGNLKNAIDKTIAFPFHAYRVLNLDSNQNNDKFSNTREAEFVAKMIHVMLSHPKLVKWESPISIGVITPYNNQKSLIQTKINERTSTVPESTKKKVSIEINTVDSFQGQERDVIIMSCVRSNGIGFMSDAQRLCVAMTRAKHSLVLCGNFATFQRDQMWCALLSDARSRGVFINIRANAPFNEIMSHVAA